MKYFLDFDGVIFDIASFKARMNTLGFAEKERTASMLTQMQQEDPTLSLTHFVFEDARAFIEAHANNCSVVSSFVSSNPLLAQSDQEARQYQERKIELSGVTSLLGASRVHVVGQSKSEALASLNKECTKAGEVCVFIDDRQEYIEEALELGIRAIWMNRATLEKSDRFPTAHSFNDVMTLV